MALELARVIQKCTRSALEVDMEKWTWRGGTELRFRIRRIF